MNQVIIDISLIAALLITAFLAGKFMKQRRAGMLLSTLLLFPPLLLFLNMWAHNFTVSAINIRRIQAGTFQYNVTFYSHFLFGFAFSALSGFGIHCTKKYLLGQLKQRRRIFFLPCSCFILFAGGIHQSN